MKRIQSIKSVVFLQIINAGMVPLFVYNLILSCESLNLFLNLGLGSTSDVEEHFEFEDSIFFATWSAVGIIRDRIMPTIGYVAKSMYAFMM